MNRKTFFATLWLAVFFLMTSQSFAQLIECEIALHNCRRDSIKNAGRLQTQAKDINKLKTEIEALEAKITNLHNENDSLHELINYRTGMRTDRASLREVKENKIITLTFKDPVFKACLLKYYDMNGDGEISQYEAEQIITLDISNQKISSLEGIEHLVNLERLDCSSQFKGILNVGKTRLTRLDLSKNTVLRKLICNNNSIAFLDISRCTELIELDCSYNQLTNLVLNGNLKLEFLNCSNNKIGGLIDINNPQLKVLLY